jgi:ATP-dependent Clp protease ATP-binding subunit ClpA
MFERFTDRARRIVVLAQEEARLLNHSWIGTEHLLLGLIAEGEGVAAKALEAVGMTIENTRERVQMVSSPGSSSPSGHIPFTPDCKASLEIALREALTLGHNYIGTEHVLLGLIRRESATTTTIFGLLNVNPSEVRMAVLRMLAPPKPEPTPPPTQVVPVEREDIRSAVEWIRAYRLIHVEDWLWENHPLRPLLEALEKSLVNPEV